MRGDDAGPRRVERGDRGAPSAAGGRARSGFVQQACVVTPTVRVLGDQPAPAIAVVAPDLLHGVPLLKS
jgi:hypothetical protein